MLPKSLSFFLSLFFANAIFAYPDNPYHEHLVDVKKTQANYGYLLEHGDIVTIILTIGNILFVDRGSIGPGKLAFPESGLPRSAVHIQNRI